MNIGDFLIWGGGVTQSAGNAMSNGGSTQDWLNFGGNAMSQLGSQLGGGIPNNGPIYVPVGGGQHIVTSNNTALYVGLGILALLILKK